MSTSELAGLLGVSDRRVRKIAEDRNFGRKVGNIWVFSDREAKQLLEDRKKSGDWRIKKHCIVNKA